MALVVVAEIDSLPNIKKAVQAGLACTVLSPGAVADEVAAGQLAVATIGRPQIARKVVCATSLTRPLTPPSAAMITLFEGVIRDLVRSKSWPARWVGTD